MTMHTDCRARRVRTQGCDCDYCRDNAILADGEGVSVSVRFSDSGAPEADPWPASIFDAAGVPMKADEGEHDRLLRAGMKAEAAEEREKARRRAREEGRKPQAFQEVDGAWDKAIENFNKSAGGGVREAYFSRA